MRSSQVGNLANLEIRGAHAEHKSNLATIVAVSLLGIRLKDLSLYFPTDFIQLCILCYHVYLEAITLVVLIDLVKPSAYIVPLLFLNWLFVINS
jgi:hypothetical protein